MDNSDPNIKVYQLSGLDERERGFTRQVECTFNENLYHVVLRYERVNVEGSSPMNETSALQNLVEILHTSGYTQLRSQLIFQGKTYLGSQELWVDYPDPERVAEKRRTLIESIRDWFNQKRLLRRRNKILRQF